MKMLFEASQILGHEVAMPDQLWKDLKRRNAQELISLLLDKTGQNGNLLFDWEVNIAFAELMASSSVTSPKLSKPDIAVVIQEMKKTGKSSVEDFEAIYGQIRKMRPAPSLDQIWEFYIPIELKLSTNQPAKITLLGKEFSFLTKNDVLPQLDADNAKLVNDLDYFTAESTQDESKIRLLHWLNQTTRRLRNEINLLGFRSRFITREDVENLPEVFLFVSEKTDRHTTAWTRVEPAYNALRGLIEFTVGFANLKISSTMTSYRRAVPPPLFVIVRKPPNQYDRWDFVTDYGGVRKPFELTDARFDKIVKNGAQLTQQQKKISTNSLIADCLRLYSEAMDAKFLHESFAGFWQLAEAITCSRTANGDTATVCNRLAWHSSRLGLKGSGYAETLKVYSKLRNDVVHRRIHETYDDEVNILKFACDVALLWLFQVSTSIPTISHLEQFYAHKDKGDADLTAIEESIAFIRKQRKNAGG